MTDLTKYFIYFIFSYAENAVFFATYFVLFGWSISQMKKKYIISFVLISTFIFIAKILELSQSIIFLTNIVATISILIWIARKINIRLFGGWFVGFLIVILVEQIVATLFSIIFGISVKQMMTEPTIFYVVMIVILFKLLIYLALRKLDIKFFQYES